MTEAAGDGELALSLVRGDPLWRAQRALGLVPRGGLGVGRRALAFALITWAPIALWALLRHRALPGTVAEPLLAHFGIHVRCLVAIPLFVVAEAIAHGVTTRVVPYFVRSGLVADAQRERFARTLRGVARLRDATLPWVVILGALVAWQLVGPSPASLHELVWAGEPESPGFGFGAWWFAWVARPAFMALLLAWLWRLFLALVLCARLARLDLALVPTHPDRAGGLGFLEALPTAFSPVVLGLSAVLASRWSHGVLYHGEHVAALRMQMIAFGVAVAVLFLSPLLAFAPALVAAKRRAVLEYAALVGAHGRLVERRWIAREAVDDRGLLSAPELGPVADTLTLYEAVGRMRPVPLGMRALAAVLVPAALPMLVVLAIEVPVKDLLLGILKTLT